MRPPAQAAVVQARSQRLEAHGPGKHADAGRPAAGLYFWACRPVLELGCWLLLRGWLPWEALHHPVVADLWLWQCQHFCFKALGATAVCRDDSDEVLWGL